MNGIHASVLVYDQTGKNRIVFMVVFLQRLEDFAVFVNHEYGFSGHEGPGAVLPSTNI